jgi:hypothetical protein
MASRTIGHGPGTGGKGRRTDIGQPGRPGDGKMRPGRAVHAEPSAGRPDATLSRDPAGAATPGRPQPPTKTYQARSLRPCSR